MNIKEEIGLRIREQRKAKGLTRKALAELTDDLKPSRINNWERGIRTPGPEEIKQLARILEVSPAFLMHLTDEKQPEKIPGLGALIPLLDHKQACDPQTHIQDIRDQENNDAITFIPVSVELATGLGKFAFALKVIDDSMTPEMRVNDIQIVDPSASPNPGDYVAVKISGKHAVFICQYKKLSYVSSEFELMTLNEHWPNITVSEHVQVEIIGKVVQNIRIYL
ncbi:MAG: XRE family transcriptional regulator [Legionellaceae bacterium]|nr:XRE family transcriptional regulator [Legionellaceae bacterium]